MSTLNVTMPESTSTCNGKQVTFRAPCDCIGVENIVINGKTYALLNTADKPVYNDNIFVSGALVSVIIDEDNNKAYIQNASTIVDYHVTLSANNWKLDNVSGRYYYQDVTINGILASDNPVVDIDPKSGDDILDIYEHNDNMCKIFHIATSNGTIKIYATEIIKKDLPIQLKVVR